MPVPARDVSLVVDQTSVLFSGVEAARCRTSGAGAEGYLSWHGQRLDRDGEVEASASLAVIEGGDADSQMTGTISMADQAYELMPVDGRVHAFYPIADGITDDDHAPPVAPNVESDATESSEPGATSTTAPEADVGTTTPSGVDDSSAEPAEPEAEGDRPDESDGGTIPQGDELPGGGGDGSPIAPEPEDLSGVAGDSADPAPGEIDGGQPRPGGPSGNRTISVQFAYANGMTSTQAYLYMVNRTAQTNDAFINSGMPVRVTASGPVAANYTQSSYLGTDLTNLREPGSGMDSLLASWQSSGHDALALLVPDANGACGIGHLSQSVEVNTSFLSVSAMESGCDYTFTHELGHNLSADHNPENGRAGDAFPWSYGHYVSGKGRTVMSYLNPCSGSCPRKLQFSDPDNDLLGYAGTPSGTAYRDNDRSITDTSWAAADAGGTSSNDHIWYSDSSGYSSHNVNATYGNDMEAPFTPIAGDFNGDGRDDQFWYFPGRPAERLWAFNSGTGSYTAHTKDIVGVYRPVAGDFDGDGYDDIFWHAPGSATDWIWWGGSSASSFGSTVSSATVGGSYNPQAGDVDGDGDDDMIWYAAGTAPDYIWPGNANRASFAVGTGSSGKTINGLFHLQTADVNADGYEDLVWYGPGSGSDFIWHGRSTISSIGPSYQTTYTQGNSLTPRAGDFNADGRGDIFWYGPGSEPDSIWWGQTSFATFTSPVSSSRGVSGIYDPTVGDFDGDSYDDLYWFAFG